MTEHAIPALLDAAGIRSVEWYPAGIEILDVPESCHIIITPDTPGEYLVGIYTDDDYTTGEMAVYFESANVAAIVRTVTHLMHDQPEGVDWHAWAAQRVADLTDDSDQLARI